MRSDIRSLAIGCILIVVWQAPVFGTSARAKFYPSGKHAELLVVRIIGPATEAAGILFYIDDHDVYGITAKHVVFQEGKVIAGLQTELRAWPGRQFPVEILKLHPEKDLALFRAALAPPGLSRGEVVWFIPQGQLGASGDLGRGDMLFRLGHSVAGAWIFSQAPGQFAGADGADAFLFEAACPEGYAGGPVFDERWRLVGMMTEEKRPFCHALRIESVLKIVQGWKPGVNLGLPPPENDGTPVSRRINLFVGIRHLDDADFENRGDDMPQERWAHKLASRSLSR